MPTKVLVTGFDQIIEGLGKAVVPALEAHKGVEAHCVRAVDENKQAEALKMLGEVDIVVLNPASKDRRFDNVVLETFGSRSDRRLVIVADTWQAWRRVAPEYRGHVSALAVCFPDEVAQARAEGYCYALTAGIPPHWGKMYEGIMNVPLIRPSTRLPLVGGGTRRRDQMRLVYFGGMKKPSLMNKILRALAPAMPADGVLCFRPHPTEGADETTLAERAKITHDIAMLDHKKAGLDNSNAMVASADVSVFTGGATDSIGATYARKCSLYFFDEEVRDYNIEANSLPNGLWFVPERGGSLYADEGNLGITLRLLLENPNALREAQEQNFPLPKTWDTGPALATFILGA